MMGTSELLLHGAPCSLAEIAGNLLGSLQSLWGVLRRRANLKSGTHGGRKARERLVCMGFWD